MKKEKEIIVLNKHIHIDNGGYSFRFTAINNGDDEFYSDGLEISNSFYGYSENIMKLNHLGGNHLEELGKLFILASDKLKQLNKK